MLGAASATSPHVATRTTSDWVLAVLLGLTMVGPSYAHAFTRHGYVLAASILAFAPLVMWLATVAINNGTPDLRRIFGLTALVVLPLSISILLNATGYGSMQFAATLWRVVACALYMLLAGFLFYHPRRDEITSIAFPLLVLVLFALFVSKQIINPAEHWGRLRPGDLRANYWGEIFQVAVLAAAFARPRWFFYGVVIIAFGGLLAVQARGSTLATAIIVLFAVLAREGLRRLLLLGALILFFVLPPAVAADNLVFEGRLFGGITEFVANDVLRLNDPNRGLGSGFTGRTAGYEFAWNEFADRPLLGYGLGLTTKASAKAGAGAVHNGHLQLLADLGLLLYLFIFVTMLGALVRSGVQGNWLVFGGLLSFYFILSFQPRSINVSVVPMVGMMLVVWGWLLPRPLVETAAVVRKTARRRLGEGWQSRGARPSTTP